LRLIVLLAGLALYVAALFVPAIVFRPDVRSNPKHGECSSVIKDNVYCEAFTFGRNGSIVCDDEAMPGKTYIDKQKIRDYCKGWDVPMGSSSEGYVALLMGMLSIFDGMLAWLANPLILMAVLMSVFGQRRAALIVSVAAIAVGLQSYALDGVAFSAVAVDGKNMVDHLGLGFYLWMASLVTFAVFCFLKKPTPARAEAR